MIKISQKVILSYPVKNVWEVITNNEVFSWRTDISQIKIIDNQKFIEYTKSGIPTYFTIIKKEQYKLYEFTLLNKNIKGSWTGIFNSLDKDKTELELIEKIDTNNVIIKLLAKSYLRSHQKRYIRDLKNKLR